MRQIENAEAGFFVNGVRFEFRDRLSSAALGSTTPPCTTNFDSRPVAPVRTVLHCFSLDDCNEACFSFNAPKFPSSQQATKLSVTHFKSSHRVRICLASLAVI